MLPQNTMEVQPSLKELYRIPQIRIIETQLKLFFLESNTEPIDGGDDPYIPW